VGDEKKLPVFVHVNYGPGSATCRCKCPESCEHVWDGPIYQDEQVTTTTCSRCGKHSIDHDMVLSWD